MFTLAPTELAFLETARTRHCATFEIERPAEVVWSELTGERPLHWCRAVKSITWTSRRPFGVGTTRTAKVLGGMSVLDERFIRWEEGRRKTFVGVRANLPLFRRIAEDYLVQAIDEERCRLAWTIAVEPSAIGRPGRRLNEVVFESMFEHTRRHFGDPSPPL